MSRAVRCTLVLLGSLSLASCLSKRSLSLGSHVPPDSGQAAEGGAATEPDDDGSDDDDMDEEVERSRNN